MKQKRRGGRGQRVTPRVDVRRARDFKKLNRQNTSRWRSSQLSSAEALGHWAKGLRGRRTERNRAATTPRTIHSTVAIVREGGIFDTVPRSRPSGGRPPRRGSRVPSANPPRAARAEEKIHRAHARRFRAGDARSTATLGSRSRSVRRHDPRASPRRSRPSRSRDARELPECVARHADCRALFRADTIAGVFASRRTFCWTRTASTGAAAFATMAVRRAVLPERAATRAGSAILQV